MKRVIWMAAGAAMVTVGKRWTVRKAAVVADQFTPAAVGKRMAAGVSQRVDAAKREGRAAMADTEQRLREKLTAR